MPYDIQVERVLRLAIGIREDRLRAEKALEALRLKEEHAMNVLADLVKQMKL